MYIYIYIWEPYIYIFILYNYTFIYIYTYIYVIPPLPKTLVVIWPTFLMWFCHQKAICIVGFLAGKAPWKQWLLFWNHQTPNSSQTFRKRGLPTFQKESEPFDSWSLGCSILTDTFPALGLEFHLGPPYFRTFLKVGLWFQTNPFEKYAQVKLDSISPREN